MTSSKRPKGQSFPLLQCALCFDIDAHVLAYILSSDCSCLPKYSKSSQNECFSLPCGWLSSKHQLTNLFETVLGRPLHNQFKCLGGAKGLAMVVGCLLLLQWGKWGGGENRKICWVHSTLKHGYTGRFSSLVSWCFDQLTTKDYIRAGNDIKSSHSSHSACKSLNHNFFFIFLTTTTLLKYFT